MSSPVHHPSSLFFLLLADRNPLSGLYFWFLCTILWFNSFLEWTPSSRDFCVVLRRYLSPHLKSCVSSVSLFYHIPRSSLCVPISCSSYRFGCLPVQLLIHNIQYLSSIFLPPFSSSSPEFGIYLKFRPLFLDLPRRIISHSQKPLFLFFPLVRSIIHSSGKNFKTLCLNFCF